MREFIIGVVSSLAATTVTVIGGWFGLSWPKRFAIRLLSRLTGTGIVRVYPQQKIANAALAADLRKARWVRVLAPRGNELTRDSFQALWQGEAEHVESVQVLLPDPADTGGWLRAREEDLRGTDPGFEPGLLAKQVSANVDYLNAIAARNPMVALRLFDAPHTCRVIATDRVAYFTLFTGRGHGRNSPCLVVASDGIMYEHALALFAQLWRAAYSDSAA
ncbi:hypothetical protein [Nonomuraea lactucae]|uniref:hypothetical protein n=1 Tax=Nonomuraea lactucae TaxID=2249762 RepID=UPI000DE47407|nr:hypothetical protein [Nonomuraea lactucae]